MKAGFKPGIVRELSFVVTEEMCPAFDGLVVHRCCSTWTVAHQFELAARMVLTDFLEDHEEGLGSHVSVDHKAPCPIGRIVRVEARLTEICTDRRHPRVTCALSAHDGDRPSKLVSPVLATGKQVQVVMNKDRLKQYIERS